jgi:hypothetical protein
MSKFAVLGSILLLSVLSFGQDWRGVPGYCPYGCGPYVPLITTPNLSFATVSPNPVGATNATGGLVAGATNSTLSEIVDNSSAVYTVPVWYSGGQTPIISPITEESGANRLGHERGMRGTEFENHPEHAREMRGMEAENRPEHERKMRHMETEPAVGGEEPQPQTWVFIGASEQPSGGPGAAQKAKRTYTNDDVTRQNQQNGVVKYDGKTEKI